VPTACNKPYTGAVGSSLCFVPKSSCFEAVLIQLNARTSAVRLLLFFYTDLRPDAGGEYSAALCGGHPQTPGLRDGGPGGGGGGGAQGQRPCYYFEIGPGRLNFVPQGLVFGVLRPIKRGGEAAGRVLLPQKITKNAVLLSLKKRPCCSPAPGLPVPPPVCGCAYPHLH
jgi:hypothetical protein